MPRRLFSALSAGCRRWVERVYAYDDDLYARMHASPAFAVVVSILIEVCLLVVFAIVWESLRETGDRLRLLLVAACLTVAGAMLLRDRLRTLRAALAERRLKAGLCPACGYDLRVTPERCPECGAGAKGGIRMIRCSSGASSGGWSPVRQQSPDAHRA